MWGGQATRLECFWTANSIYYMQYSPYLRAIPPTLTVWTTHEQHILWTYKICCLHVVQMVKTNKIAWWWWVYWNLAAENSDIIWARKLLKGSMITSLQLDPVLWSPVMIFLYQREPFFIFISWLRTSVYYNAPFERWHKSK